MKILIPLLIGYTKNDYELAKKFVLSYIEPLVCSLESLGHSCKIIDNLQDLIAYDYNNNPDLTIMWGGDSDADALLIKTLGEHRNYLFMETAWFPQRDYVYFDRVGVNANSSIRNISRPLHIIIDEERIENWKRNYRKGFDITNEDYIFVPLQVENDSNIVRHSQIDTMQRFVNYICDLLPNNIIVFREHPRDMGVIETLPSNGRLNNVAPLSWLLAGCSSVVGINSTVLLEALAFNKPVTSFGEGIATGIGVFYDTDIFKATESNILNNKYNIGRSNQFLNFLVFKKQFHKSLLSNPDEVRAHLWQYIKGI